MTTINIGIVGNGFVGKATSLFAGDFVNVLVYDIDENKCVPLGTTVQDITKVSDIIFVCVPTPVTLRGNCYVDSVEQVVASLKCCHPKGSIVIRSTVPPGTCARLQVHHMPEFLREQSWEYDFRMCDKWIVGQWCFTDDLFRLRIAQLLAHATRDGQIKSNEIFWGTSDETELAKYARNAFLATKLSFMNEIEEFARLKGINYSNVRELIGIDERIGWSHTQVPGSDGNRGFGGTCLPKDLAVLKHEMDNIGSHPIISTAVLERNNTIDRPRKDWENLIGRSIVGRVEKNENVVQDN